MRHRFTLAFCVLVLLSAQSAGATSIVPMSAEELKKYDLDGSGTIQIKTEQRLLLQHLKNPVMRAYDHNPMNGKLDPAEIIAIQENNVAKLSAPYGERSGDGFKLKRTAKEGVKRTSHNICAIWVDRDSDKVFWAYLHPNTSTAPQIYGQHHEVSPAMRYDLGRFRGRSASNPIGGKGVIVSSKAGSSFRTSRKTSLDHYRSLKTVKSPVMGDIEFTRIGWRHMFRRSRAASNKAASIEIVPHLQRILSQRPTAHSVMLIGIENKGGYEHRICEHLLKFDQVLIDIPGAPRKRVTAHFRLIEDIRYSDKWKESAMLSQQVERRVVLKSAYYK